MSTGAHVERIDPTKRLEDEAEQVKDEAAKHFHDPDDWLRRPHPMLGGRSPDECIQVGDEQMVWDLLRNLKYVGQA